MRTLIELQTDLRKHKEIDFYIKTTQEKVLWRN